MPATEMARALLIYFCISTGTTAAIALVTSRMGWTVTSPAWSLLVPIAMWAPALAAYIARRAERPPFMTRMPLGRWGITRAGVILVPLAIPLVVYGAAYTIAVDAGFAHRNPGAADGRRTRRLPRISSSISRSQASSAP